MPRCLNCNRLAGPRHFQEHPDHEAFIDDNISPRARKTLLQQIDNHRMYGKLKPVNEATKANARRQARYLAKAGVDIRKYVTGQGDYAERLEGADGLNYNLRKDHVTDDSGSMWWIAIPVAVVAIGIGVVILSNKSNGDSKNNLNDDNSYNLLSHSVDLLESEMDIFQREVW